MNESEERVIHHDMRGSLNTIKLSVEVLKAEAPPDADLYFIDSIGREVGKIDELISVLSRARKAKEALAAAA